MGKELWTLLLSAAVVASCSGVQKSNIPESVKPINSQPTSIKTPEPAFSFSISAQSWSGFADMDHDSSSIREGDIVNITLGKELSIQRIPSLQRTTDNKGLVKVLGNIEGKQGWFVIEVDLPENKHAKTTLETFAESIPAKEGLMRIPKDTILSLRFRRFQLPTAQGLPPDIFPAYQLRIPPIPLKTP